MRTGRPCGRIGESCFRMKGQLFPGYLGVHFFRAGFRADFLDVFEEFRRVSYGTYVYRG